MKRRVIILTVMISVILGMLIASASENAGNIKKIFKNVPEENVLSSLEMVNWMKNPENGYISATDSHMISNDINSYVFDIIIDSENDLSGLEPKIYYTSIKEEQFSEEKSFITKVDYIGGRNILSINQEICNLRVDLLEEEGYKFHLTNFIINPRHWHISLIRSLVYMLSLTVFNVFMYFNWEKRDAYIAVYKKRGMIVSLVKNDLKMRYAGSVLGLVWAFVQPLMTIFVFWFVFQVGFKNSPVNDVPFILWMISGYVPWIYFADAVSNSSSTFQEYSYLVKKIKFQTSILPFVKVLSASMIHLFFIGFIFIIFSIYHMKLGFIALQMLYYTFALFMLVTGLAWLVSTISVFFKDFGQIIGVLLQVGFWMSPIFWDPRQITPEIVKILKLNPLFYIIQGYRDSLINKIPFYVHIDMTIYYWTLTAVVFAAGVLLYKKLKEHFADVL